MLNTPAHGYVVTEEDLFFYMTIPAGDWKGGLCAAGRANGPTRRARYVVLKFTPSNLNLDLGTMYANTTIVAMTMHAWILFHIMNRTAGIVASTA